MSRELYPFTQLFFVFFYIRRVVQVPRTVYDEQIVYIDVPKTIFEKHTRKIQVPKTVMSQREVNFLFLIQMCPKL
jgi:hypothetical protein